RFSFAIIHSTTVLLPLWRKTCTRFELEARLIPRDVATRWNSSYDMLKFAIEYRQAIDNLTATKKELRKFELEEEEWKTLVDLCRLFKKLTLQFSQEGVVTIAHVIPAMDKIQDMLDAEGTSAGLSSAIKYALKKGQKLMNTYYSRTDNSHAYRVAMSMSYFRLRIVLHLVLPQFCTLL
ncbi:hypothetical protein B0H12DRAFT_1038619, partial [Mycena haematopus]